MPAEIAVAAPATSANLGPGFDVFGIALNLFDEYRFKSAAEVSVTVEGQGSEMVELDETNLAIAAARQLCASRGQEFSHNNLLEKLFIPIQRGLGSSAGAICAGLTAANARLAEPAPVEELVEIAVGLEGHPDNVVPALVGGFCIVLDSGPRPDWIRIEPPPELRFVVAVPALHIPTAASRRMLPRRVPIEDAVFNVGRAAMLVAALTQGDFPKLAHAMEDRLHQPYRRQLHPVMDQMIAAALATGAYGAALSGSGSTIVALCPESAESVPLAMRAVCEAAGFSCSASLLETSLRGAHQV